MTDKTDSKEREDFTRWAQGQTWIKDCAPATHGRKEAFGHWDTEKAWLSFQAGRASLAASAGSESVELDHIACIEGGELRYMTGRKAPSYDCELYAMPGGKSAPPLYTHPSPPEGKVGGWISVDERLPEPNVEVLCAGQGWGNPFVTACYYDDERREWYPINTHWTDSTGSAQYPTHWMPLPPPPTTSAGSGKGE